MFFILIYPWFKIEYNAYTKKVFINLIDTLREEEVKLVKLETFSFFNFIPYNRIIKVKSTTKSFKISKNVQYYFITKNLQQEITIKIN